MGRFTQCTGSALGSALSKGHFGHVVEIAAENTVHCTECTLQCDALCFCKQKQILKGRARGRALSYGKSPGSRYGALPGLTTNQFGREIAAC